MSWWVMIALSASIVVHGNAAAVTPRPGHGLGDVTVHPNSVPETVESTRDPAEVEGRDSRPLQLEGDEEVVVMTGKLNPNHYVATRAAKVVEHYVNTRHGSPYKRFLLESVHSGHAEDVPEAGRHYRLELSLQELVSNTTVHCSAEVDFPSDQSSPVVQASCEELLKINTTSEEEALYQQHRTSNALVSGSHIPDSVGHIEPGMKPFWYLGGVASSVIMLQQSNESTLYNMAQVANVTQLETQNDQLRFNYEVLLHDMVSEEIIHWKLLVTWSPAEGTKVSQMEKMPKCFCEAHPSTDS